MENKGNRINIELINNYLIENNLSKSMFCKRCGISYITFQKIMSGKTNFRITALIRVAWGIGVEFYQLFY